MPTHSHSYSLDIREIAASATRWQAGRWNSFLQIRNETLLFRGVDLVQVALAAMNPAPTTADLWKPGAPAVYESVRSHAPATDDHVLEYCAYLPEATMLLLKYLEEGLARAILAIHDPNSLVGLQTSLMLGVREIVADWILQRGEETAVDGFAFRQMVLDAIGGQHGLEWSHDLPDAHTGTNKITNSLGETAGDAFIEVDPEEDPNDDSADFPFLAHHAPTGKKRTKAHMVKVLHSDGTEESRSYKVVRNKAVWSLANNHAAIAARLEALAASTDYDAQALIVRTPRGRLARDQQPRFEALARIVWQLRTEGAQFDAIGSVTGRSKSQVHGLAQRGKALEAINRTFSHPQE